MLFDFLVGAPEPKSENGPRFFASKMHLVIFLKLGFNLKSMLYSQHSPFFIIIIFLENLLSLKAS